MLQNIHRLPPLLERRALPSTRLRKIHQHRECLLTWRHQVDRPLHHKHQMLDLPVALLCVLPRGVQVVARPARVVVAYNYFFSGLVLDLHVLRRELGVEPVFAPPDQRGP